MRRPASVFLNGAALRAAKVVRRIRRALSCGHPPFTSMDALILSGKSVVRWGDGETNLLLLRPVHFQGASIPLMLDLLKILIKKDRAYVLCWPPHLAEYPDHIGRPEYRRLWSKTIFIWEAFSWRFGARVSDAYSFRREGGNRAELMNLLLHRVNVFCVISKNAEDAQFVSAIIGAPVAHVCCPNRNTYEQLSKLTLEFVASIPKSVLPHGQLRRAVLVSAGPAGKVLISNLAGSPECSEIQFLDVGHMFDHGLM